MDEAEREKLDSWKWMDERFIYWLKRPLPAAEQYSLYDHSTQFHYWLEEVSKDYRYDATVRAAICANLNDPLGGPPMEQVLEKDKLSDPDDNSQEDYYGKAPKYLIESDINREMDKIKGRISTSYYKQRQINQRLYEQAAAKQYYRKYKDGIPGELRDVL